jgi:hypothetical protein
MIFLLITRSIQTVFTASGIKHVCCAVLCLGRDGTDSPTTQNSMTYVIPEAINTVQMLLMMSENITRNIYSSQGTIN